MKILLIEPDKVLADTYRALFIADGHKVTMCASAQAAIFAADDAQPDIVVLELQMAQHSGIEFLYEFRSYRDWSAVPVIVLSGIPAGEFTTSWELLRDRLGVKAYHYKPLTSLRALRRSVTAVATA